MLNIEIRRRKFIDSKQNLTNLKAFELKIDIFNVLDID